MGSHEQLVVTGRRQVRHGDRLLLGQDIAGQQDPLRLGEGPVLDGEEVDVAPATLPTGQMDGHWARVDGEQGFAFWSHRNWKEERKISVMWFVIWKKKKDKYLALLSL